MCTNEFAEEDVEFFFWPGHGVAKRLMPRGMSDYHVVYTTDDGFTLYVCGSYFRAQFKGVTTKLFSTKADAIFDLYKRLHKP